MKKVSQLGVSHLIVLLALVAVTISAYTGYRVYTYGKAIDSGEVTLATRDVGDDENESRDINIAKNKSAWATGQRFKIATYNTRFDVPAAQTVEDIKQLIVAGADIIALQEITNNGRAQAIRDRIIQCPNCNFGGYLPSGDNREELPIIWNREIFKLEAAHSRLAAPASWPDGGGKLRSLRVNVVRLQVKKTGRIIRVMNNHLPAHIEEAGMPTNSKPDRMARYVDNMENIKSKIRSINEKNGNPVFVAGDFNVNYRIDKVKQAARFPYASLGSVDTVSSYKKLGETQQGTFRSSGRLIDYIFVRNHRAVTLESQRVISDGLRSDHNALLVTVLVK